MFDSWGCLCHRIGFYSTDNNIGDTGATSLSESLKSNTTLTELNLRSEYRRRHTKDIHQQFTLFLSLFTSIGNKIGYTGATSLSKSLKSNTTLTELNLSCEDKRRYTKDIHQQVTLPFSSHQQTTTLETQEQHH